MQKQNTNTKTKSKKEVLRSHLRYIEKSKDFRFSLGNAEYILLRSDKADKRINSRIACSFAFAIPNNLNYEQVKNFMNEIRQRIADFNNMNTDDIFIGFHDSEGISGYGNKHLHIVILNLDKNDKSIILGRNKNKLEEFNKMMQSILLKKGYTIKREKEEERINHIGMRLRYDDELRKDYLEYLSNKNQELKKEEIITIEDRIEELRRKRKELERLIKGEEEGTQEERKEQREKEKEKQIEKENNQDYFNLDL